MDAGHTEPLLGSTEADISTRGRGWPHKTNPTRVVKQTRENGRVRYLSDGEEERLRAAIQKSFPERLAEFEIALMTGLRHSEQFMREWSDIDPALERFACLKPRTGN